MALEAARLPFVQASNANEDVDRSATACHVRSSPLRHQWHRPAPPFRPVHAPDRPSLYPHLILVAVSHLITPRADQIPLADKAADDGKLPQGLGLEIATRFRGSIEAVLELLWPASSE